MNAQVCSQEKKKLYNLILSRLCAEKVEGEENRDQFLRDLFDKGSNLKGECSLFGFAKKLCQEYEGGHWDFYVGHNDCLFAVPANVSDFVRISVWQNRYDGEMTKEAFGVVCTLLSLASLLFLNPNNQCFAINHEALMEYAMTHPEWQKILEAIDGSY